MFTALKRIAVILAAILLGAAPAWAQLEVRVEAYTGQPFGIGRLEIQMPKHELPEPLGVDGLAISERNGRVYYPSADSPNIGPLIKDILDATPLVRGGPIREGIGGLLDQILDQPPRTNLYFLFTGKGPLDITLQARTPHKIALTPRNDPAARQRLMAEWWKRYTAGPGLLQQKPDYPPLVENYLTSTLARRLNLKLPEKKQTPLPEAELREQVGLTLGTESIRIGMQQDRILGLNNLDLPADR
ncbi:MAG: hypothetical protein V3V75_06780, partial [Thermoguttaceae bacterium]